jgi:hypothetical protein
MRNPSETAMSFAPNVRLSAGLIKIKPIGSRLSMIVETTE